MIKTSGLKQEVPTTDGTLSILKGIDLEIKEGESVAIVGVSGSGKSTLLGMLAGLDTPSSGKVFLGDHDLTAMTEEQRAKVRGDSVAFVFQNFQLLQSLTALENVMLPLEVKGLDKPGEKAEHFLDRVGLKGRHSHYPKQLSGGEQQRVALARAFASNAPVMFADEPTGNLDTRTGDKIANLLFDMNKEAGTTLVLVTHDPDLANRCDRQIEINAGEVV